MYKHRKATGETIKYDDIPDTMYSGSLPIASKKRMSKKKATSKPTEDKEASELKPEKAKKEKDSQGVGTSMPTIQEEAQELEPSKILNRRTRGGNSTGSSQSLPPQPSIPKKKRKQIRKIVLQEEDDATDLVTREVRRKKAADIVALQQTLEIAKEIEVPAEVLLKESTVADAHKVVKLVANLQELVVAGELLNDTKEVQKEDVACSDVGTSEADASRAIRGNTDSHNLFNNVIDVESSSISTSNTNSVSTSSDIDDIA